LNFADRWYQASCVSDPHHPPAAMEAAVARGRAAPRAPASTSCSDDVFQRFFAMSIDMCAVSRLDGVLTHVNPAFASLGYAPDDLLDRCFLEFVHADDEAATRAELEKLARGVPTIHFENRVRCKDGSYRWIGWTSNPCNGVLVSIGRDVTEKKQLQADLARQGHEYQAIFDSLPQMIWLKDDDNGIIRANAAAARSIGRTPAEVEGQSTFVLYPEHAAKYGRDDLETIRAGTPKLDIEPYEVAPGDVRWVRTDKTPYRDASGNVVGVVVSATDVTSWKRGEEERARLYEQLKELDRVKSQFFANVSHELRTPLTLIAGPVEKLLRDEGLPREQRTDLELVQRNVRVLHKYIDDLLDVAKLEAGRMDLGYAEIDLADLVRVLCANSIGLAAERDIALRVETGAGLPAHADAEKIGRVRVTLSSDGSRAHLEVADDGPGVPRDLRDVVFERFRQADGAHRRFGGTGLGLAIAKDFVDLHGRHMGIADAPEGGALFFAEWPLAAPPGTPVAAAPRSARVDDAVLRQTVATIGATRPRSELGLAPLDAPAVLVVDDDADMVCFLATTLEHEFRVSTAADGLEGIDKARALRPDLIITDVMMPRCSGDELVRAVREDEALAATPIIVLTAKADDDLRVRLLSQGAQDYLAKPFCADELLARARNLVAIKRTHDLLQAELDTRLGDLEELAREVTERKRELEGALKATRIARTQAEKASHAKTTFLGLVSHELTTPLQSMRLNLELLQRMPEPFSPPLQERIEKIARASNRLLEMIEALLEFVRLESEKLEVCREDVSLAQVAGAVVEDLGVQARHKGLELRLSVPRDLPPARTDAKLFRHILANLVVNAIKYTDHGHVEITLDHDERRHRVRVSDTGHGIPREKQATIFEPFTQLEALRQKHTPGVGLGLTLVRELVKVLGGTISVSSRVGAGSTFTLQLPRA
jgi:PAS domain S-box-containing protein